MPYPGNVKTFYARAKVAEEVYPVVVHLVQTLGNRRQYLTGTLQSPHLTGESQTVPWRGDLSFQVYGGDRLGTFAKRDLARLLTEGEGAVPVFTQEELEDALADPDPGWLWRRSDQVRAQWMGPEVYLRGLLEISNHCKRDCLYCGLRKSRRDLARYRMPVEQILESAHQAAALGYGTVVIQSGEDDGYALDDLCSAVLRIKAETGCAVTLSLGERSREDYRALREAGADRYLLKFETSNRELFQKLKSDSVFEERVQCLVWLRELGYQVGSGCMVGLPGQTREDLARDLLFIQKMDFDMVGIGPFLPNPNTPLRDAVIQPSELTLRMVALARILTRNAHLPATTALGTLDPRGRQRALQAGANILMPNLTPAEYRPLYEIYPNKICITEGPSDCGFCLPAMISGLGRTLGQGPGHSKREQQGSDPGLTPSPSKLFRAAQRCGCLR